MARRTPAKGVLGVVDFVDALLARECRGGGRALRLFGGPYVVDVSGTRADVPDGSKRLLAFVALHSGWVERRYLAGTLWATRNEERAAGNLRSALWRLSRAGLDVLVVDKTLVRLRPDVVVDAQVLGSWATRLITGATLPEDLDVLALGKDPVELLPGWYEDWVLIERERLRQRMLHAMEAVSHALVRAGRLAEAVEAALAAVAADPLRESAQRVLLEAHLAEGNWVEARRVIDAYRRTVRAELGSEADLALEDLAHAHLPRAVAAARTHR